MLSSVAKVFYFHALGCLSSNNQLADAASQFEYTQLFMLTSSMQKKPCTTHPQLHGIKNMLTCPPWLHSSYGMALLS